MCYAICTNSSKLKNSEDYKKVYVKRDTHPAYRKEHDRLYKLVGQERKHPANQGINIIYDLKAVVVTKDGNVIDRFSPNV